MDTCIKCGKPIEDGELFCAVCGMNPIAATPEDAPRRVQTPSGRMQKPVPQAVVYHAPVKQPAPAPKKAPRGLILAVVLLGILSVGLIALSAYQYIGGNTRRTELRVQEAALNERETELNDLYAQIEGLNDALDAAEAAIAAKNAEIKALTARAEAAESIANQTQYDADTQLAELERVTQENAALQLSLDSCEAENEALTQSVDTLKQSVKELTQQTDTLRKKTDFMDSYVVFVENDKTSLYHRYDCVSFAQKSFWAYSRKLAESNGYSACPLCFGD